MNLLTCPVGELQCSDTYCSATCRGLYAYVHMYTCRQHCKVQEAVMAQCHDTLRHGHLGVSMAFASPFVKFVTVSLLPYRRYQCSLVG